MSASDRYANAIQQHLELLREAHKRYEEVVRLERAIGATEHEARKAGFLAQVDHLRAPSSPSPSP